MPGRTRIKICGVGAPAIARAAAGAGADAIGLVFVAGSPRAVTLAQAAAIVAALPALVEPVALFVDAALEEVRRTAGELGLRTVQLHGGETPEFAAALRPLRVLRALPFDPRAQEAAATWQARCPNLAGLLWDAPPHGPLPGGSGRTFDWPALARLAHGGALANTPCILAGGLHPANVAQAIAAVRPFGVDVSSGVESSRGVKDEKLIEAFCAAVRRAASV